MDDFLATAVKLSYRSGIKSFKTGAVVVNKGEIITHGWSHYSNVRLAQYYSIHAELHAILRAPYRKELNGATVYVATIRSKSGNVGLAKPCVICQALLFEVGIREAVFTVDGEEWDRMEIEHV